MKVLVTGGAGFIGFALVRYLLAHTDWHVVNVDKLTYAGNLESLPGAEGNLLYLLARLDILDQDGIGALLRHEQPDAIMHLAAESHVDRSIDGPTAFIDTNITGTYRLLEETRRYWRELGGARKDNFRFHHISTDEVLGSLGETGLFREDTPYSPNSPYSASKAASGHLARAWHHTYGLPVLITNCSNNYGPFQFPEKLIPLMIVRALEGKPLPVYGNGAIVRGWLFVEDRVRALLTVLEKGVVGETYNIGGNAERRNINIVHQVCALLNEMAPRAGGAHKDLITFVQDRAGHDLRYAMDVSKIQRTLGWSPQESFEGGRGKTAQWFLDNRQWYNRVLTGAYRGERLGLEREQT